MDLNIGEIIVAKRKEKGLTQEQLAAALGVSAPAVSKWETGSTYPDITMLIPLAKVLHVSTDELLSYHNELTDSEVDTLVEEANRVYQQEGLPAGREFCRNTIREYPNSLSVKFRLGNLFQGYTGTDFGEADADSSDCYREAAAVYEEVLAAGQTKYTYPATLILSGLYVCIDELDKAESLLDSLPEINQGAEVMYASIHSLRGDKEKAVGLAQDTVRKHVPLVHHSLNILEAWAVEEEDLDKAEEVAGINLQMADLFGFGRSLVYPQMIRIMIVKGEKHKALDLLERYVEYITGLGSSSTESPVFGNLVELYGDVSYIQKLLAATLLKDEMHASLKDEPRYSQLVEALEKIV